MHCGKLLVRVALFTIVMAAITKLSAQGVDVQAPLGTSYKDYRTEGAVPIEPVSPGLPPIETQPVTSPVTTAPITAPAAAAVPEPCSSILLLAAGSAVGAWRTIRRKKLS